MKRYILLITITFLLIGCQRRREVNRPDFIIDTACTRCYMDSDFDPNIPNKWNKEVTTAEEAYDIAEPALIDLFGKESTNSQKPFSINLIDDSIWVVHGNLHQPEGMIVFGGTVYTEIRKCDGEILMVIFEE